MARGSPRSPLGTAPWESSAQATEHPDTVGEGVAVAGGKLARRADQSWTVPGVAPTGDHVAVDVALGSGVTIAVEGVDGAGKSTQCRALAEWFGRGWRRVVALPLYRADRVEDLLADLDGRSGVPAVGARYAVVAKMLARQQWLADPVLEGGGVVVYDKWSLSFAAGELVRGAGTAELRALLGHLRVPDLTVVLDVEPTAALARKAGRVGYREADMERATYKGRPVDVERLAGGGYPAGWVGERFVSFQAELRAAVNSLVTDPEWRDVFGHRLLLIPAGASPRATTDQILVAASAVAATDPGSALP